MRREREPDFICLGAQKAGTTTLFEILKQHSGICLPEKKELHFFDNSENFNKGKEWYFNHFENCDTNQINGEISPECMLFL